MRKVLDRIYAASGAVAGIFLVAICAIVAAQVAGNVVDRLLIAVAGQPIGIIIPAYSDFAGFFLAASTFLALAHTLMHGEHIRVRLVLNRLPLRVQRWAELWCAGSAGIATAVATYYAARLTYDSWRFGDAITGMVAVPLWIPQLTMVAGLCLLTVALLDTFVSVLTRSAATPAQRGAPDSAPQAPQPDI